jgi:hypothetical protein
LNSANSRPVTRRRFIATGSTGLVGNPFPIFNFLGPTPHFLIFNFLGPTPHFLARADPSFSCSFSFFPTFKGSPYFLSNVSMPYFFPRKSSTSSKGTITVYPELAKFIFS